MLCVNGALMIHTERDRPGSLCFQCHYDVLSERTIEWLQFIRGLIASADMDCHVYLNLRGRNGKQERESAEREKMTGKKENTEGGKAKRKHRDRCERKYIQSQKCFIED